MSNKRFDQIGSLLNQLNDITQNIKNKKSHIGGDKDNVGYRDLIKQEISRGKETINNIKKEFSNGFDRNDRIKVKKLQSQFEELSKQFEKECTEIIDLQLRNAIGSKGRSGSLSINSRGDSKRSGSFAGRVQPVVQPHQEYSNQTTQELQLQQLEITLSDAQPVEEMILEEYNNEVKTLVKELVMIKEITGDLQALVVEQGVQIEQANTQVQISSMDIEQANVQLKEANSLASSYRKKIVILVIILLIIIGVVVGLCVGLLK
ncbi:hypothetical protein DICPUDRAFT_77635 [Dictyostelium purpureum]|uniref:t-SNARE coiled-coil homology domain-containing protein n=1 Tax=Dictyostelium purpureum TaxID=5786 RepID=F0ZH72_DICPU|nr:uncharacterized protein DICPUDRAFT_77635 [Dictyostelium purpureum]EGC36721.1 hypothetical protein DICPUDRAFT_77635 [Dictyostelium purpureum]|eukprot:XP_003286746.1 hypothetical protein DICPUDRAFT_77635 [Dictyostelium purpureum]